jgi:alkylation response protein AidB-like acyl-CoA dehydrogenase
VTDDEVLRDTARRLFTTAETEERTDASLWGECVDLGWNLVGVSEESGGVGGTLGDLATLVREAGRGAARVPLLEDATARACLAGAGLVDAVGDARVITLSAVPVALTEGRLHGSIPSVPWASVAGHVVVATDSPASHWCLVDLSDPRVRVLEGGNLAGEPRDTVVFDQYEPISTWAATGQTTPELIARRCAVLRGCQLLGTLEKAMELTVEHAANREQFGKPINRYQAVAHHLAILRADLELATVVVDTALGAGVGDAAAIAVMRSTLGTLSEDVSARAHQVHAAIGVTREHRLHRSTLRMWAYRDEDGTQRDWTLRLGRAVVRGGPDTLWELTTPRSAS